jgi:hypothetical protein
MQSVSNRISQLVNVLRVLFVITVHKNDSKRQRTVLASYRTSFTPRRHIRRAVILIQFLHRKVFVKSESNDRHGHPGGWLPDCTRTTNTVIDNAAYRAELTRPEGNTG